MIYADNAATTAISEGALKTFIKVNEETWGNPSSLYTFGQKAKEILEGTREDIAKAIGAEFPREIFFTSGGSEADNQAIISAARIGERKGKKHIVSSAFEHHAVLHTLEKLKREGFEITDEDNFDLDKESNNLSMLSILITINIISNRKMFKLY